MVQSFPIQSFLVQVYDPQEGAQESLSGAFFFYYWILLSLQLVAGLQGIAF